MQHHEHDHEREEEMDRVRVRVGGTMESASADDRRARACAHGTRERTL